MASRTRQLTALVAKQTQAIASRRALHGSSVQKAGMTPPLPPFARIQAESGSIVENTDAIWDDGVAPELALDFDAPHVSTKEASYTWLAGFSMFALLFQVIKHTTSADDNPAIAHATDVVVPDYAALKTHAK